MDTCKLCGSTISNTYFRVHNQMSCAACARIVDEEASRDPTPFLLKGIVFAFVGACGGFLIRAAFEGVVGLAGEAGAFGILFRWFVLAGIASVVVKSAKAGSKGRGGALLQLPSVAFYYLAVSLAYVPVILFRNPNLPRNLKTLFTLSAICIGLPFTSIMRNFMNVTGLIAIFVCIGIVWAGTAAPPHPVDGPFEAAKPDEEPNFFKRRKPTPVLPEALVPATPEDVSQPAPVPPAV